MYPKARFAVSDYQNAWGSATQFDTKVQTDTEKISPDYASVIALSTRQAFASMEITLSGTGSDADLQDIKLFTKDTVMDQGSSSKISFTSQPLNPNFELVNGVHSNVDALYSIMPMLIYTNPNLGNYGLASLLEYAPLFGQQFATHDLGLRYPKATSHVDQMRSPVDGAYCSIVLYFIRYQHPHLAYCSKREHDYHDSCLHEIHRKCWASSKARTSAWLI